MPNWKKLIVSGSDANLNSLDVLASITGSTFLVNDTISIADGTAAAPSLRFTDDPDTGIYRSTDDSFNITVGGVNKFVVNSSGITSAANVYSGTSGQFRNYAGVWKATTGTTGNGFNFTSADLSDLLTISSTGDSVFKGDITINNTSSGNQLTIQSPVPDIQFIDSQATSRKARISAENGNLLFEADTDSGESNTGILFKMDGANALSFTTNKNAYFAADVSGSDVYINDWNSVSASLSTLTQNQTLNSGGTVDYVARFESADTITTGVIRDDGSTVGINAAPSANKTLYIDGTIQATGEAFFSHLDIIGSGGNSRIRDDVQLKFGTNRIFGIQYNSSGDYLEFTSGSNNLVTLLGNGNVGIGTTSPANKLHLVLDTTTDKFYIERGGSVKAYIDGNGAIVSYANLVSYGNSLTGGGGIFRYGGGMGTQTIGHQFKHVTGAFTGTSGDQTMLEIIPTINQSSTAGYTGLKVNVTETATGSGDKNLLDLQVGGTSKYKVSSDGDLTMSGDLVVAGTVTAQEFHTEFVSASIIYESGSSKFGDTSDDVHDFTGSLTVTDGTINLGKIWNPGSGGSIGVYNGAGQQSIQLYGNILRNNQSSLLLNYGVTQDIHAYSNTTSYFTLDASAQSVGIGTSSPAGKFQSYISATRYIGHNVNSGDLSVVSDNNSSPVFKVQGTGTADLVNIFDNTTEVFTILDGGNVGIGAPTPTDKLHINGNINIQDHKLYNGSSNNSAGLEFGGSRVNLHGYNGINFYSSTAGVGSQTLRMQIGNDGALKFNSYGLGNNTASLAYSLGVDSSGNVIEFSGGSGGSVSSITGGADTRVAYFNGSDSLEGSANFTWDDTQLTVVGDVEAEEFIGDLRGAVLFKAQAGEALSKGDVVYISGISGNTTVVSKADADDANKMPAFGIAAAAASLNNPIDIYTVGTLSGLDTSGFTIGDELYVSSSAGELTATAPTGESSLIQKIAKVTRVDNAAGSIKISGAGRTNATPNLNEGRLFVGNASNQAVADGTVHVDIANSRVGIGTTSPSTKLHITDTASAFQFTADTGTAGDGRLNIGHFSNGTFIGTYGDDGGAADVLRFGTHSGDERMRIASDGKVGIGTTTPANLLHVQGSPTSTGVLGRFYGSSTLGSLIQFDRGSSYNWKAGIGGASSTTDIPTSYFGIAETTQGSRLVIAHTTGYVGIGTTSPSATLDVHGRVDFANDFRLRGTDSAADQGVVRFYVNSNNELTIDTANNGNNLFVIDEGGQVGINTSSPSRTLDVNGEIQNNGIFRKGGNVIIKSTGSETMFGPGGSGIITFHNSATMTTSDETMRIDANGNLLLNNTSAGARLDIREDTNYAIRAEDASGHYFRVNTGGDVDMRGDLTVQGVITAQEFHTEFVSASIIYDSGSTKFGDTQDDDHDFTGSLNVSGSVHLTDNSTLKIGDASGGDLQLYHNGSHSLISNQTGNLYIRNQTNDGDIIFQGDDGSGGDTTYFTLDGSQTRTQFNQDVMLIGGNNYIQVDNSDNSLKFADSAFLKLGTGSDLQIYHDGTNSVLNNITGNLQIYNNADDGDIQFISDNGSGGNTEYFRVDGGATKTIVSKAFQFFDSVKAEFGDSSDLQIYHDGSNSYLNETGVGSLIVQASDLFLRAGGTNNTNNALRAVNGGTVTLFHANSAKLDTTSTGITVTGDIDADDITIDDWGSVSASLSAIQTAGGVNGTGTANTIPKWSDSDTLTDSYLTQPSATTLKLSSDGSATAGTILELHFPNNNTTDRCATINFTNNVGGYAAIEGGTTGANNTGYIGFKVDNAGTQSEPMRITGNGNVGIGTTAPAFKTTIYSDSTTDSFPLVVGQPNAANEFVGIGLSGFVASNGAVKAGLVLDRKNTYGVGDIHILNNTTTDNSNATLADSKFTILQNGNVGIGTTSPGTTLHVAGEISGSAIQVIGGSSTNKFYSTNTGAIAEFKPSDSRSGMQPIFLYRSSVTGTANYMLAQGSTTRFGVYDSGVPADVSGMISITPNNSSEAPNVKIGDAGSNGAYLDIGGNIKLLNDGSSYINGGNVGIGTSSPSDKLHVSDGSFRVQATTGNTRGVRITPNGEIQQVSTSADWLHLQRSHNGKVAIGVDSTADLHVYNDLLIDSAKISYQENTDVDSAAAETVATVAHASYDAAFFDYVVKNGTNLRAGTVMAVHDGTNVEYTDNSTKDIGTTAGVTFSVDISGTDLRLRATTTTDNWTIKTLVRSI